jgi:hypothetical protein
MRWDYGSKAEKPDIWTPTAENLCVLPEPVRRFIHDLQTVCDPASDTRMIYELRVEVAGLRYECERLARKCGEWPSE